jgi:hypothetical protein
MVFRFFVILFITSTILVGQNCPNNIDKIIMIGDSWSLAAWNAGSIEDNLKQFGFSEYKMYTNLDITVGGIEAEEMLDSSKLNAITDALINKPDAEIVNISLGGNDFFTRWHKTMSNADTDLLIDTILNFMDSVIIHIQTVRPNIDIYLPLYDYPNFEEAINGIPFPQQHPSYPTWNSMGKPNFLEINNALLRLIHKVDSMTKKYGNVYYGNAAGIMQYTYGQTTPLSVAPGGTYPPYSAPLPGGFPNYPSPLGSFIKYVLFYDAFHLDNAGFNRFYEYHFQKWYWQRLRNDRDTIQFSSLLKSGAISSNSSIQSLSHIIGTSNTQEHRSILHFDTSIPNGKIVSKASIFIKRDSLSGDKPIDKKLLVSIVNGFFGNSDTIEVSDFSNQADHTDTVCISGNLANDRSWMRIDLPNSFLNYFNPNGSTQLRLSTIENDIGLMYFTNSTDSLSGAQLDLSFQTPVTLKENFKKNQILVSPNPNASGILNINKDFGKGISALIIDLNGKRLERKLENNRINISDLPNGIYFIEIEFEGNFYHSKFIKVNS